MERLLGKYFVVAAIVSLVVTPASAALPDKSCSLDDDCTGGLNPIANSVCNKDDKCACAPAFQEDGVVCVAKAVSEIDCSTEATVCVAHSTCVGTETKKCQCDSAYKEGTGSAVNTCVPKAVSEIDCTTDAAVCVTHSTCVGTATKKCQCDSAYKEGAGTALNTCVPKAVSEIDCSTEATVCVTHSTCIGTGTKKCQCDSAYKEGTGTAINTCVPKGLDDSCTTESDDCIGVSNAECVGETGKEKCTCKTDYKKENGECNTANGLQTLLSAPVALLLSFLTIVFTRLH